MKFRIWKSLTFFIGLILFIAAFGVILVAGSIFNPPPYRIVIALESIPPYTTLTRDMLAVDEQTMHQRVASRLVHEAEIEVYLGGMVIETIHAGEPLRRNAVVAADNPAAVRRLSLALTDPSMIAAVIPVSSSGSNAAIIPNNVSAGDYVNVTMGLAGSVNSMASSSSSASQWGAPPSLTTPTPTPALTSTLPPTSTLLASPSPLPLSGEVPEVAPPLDKIVLPHVQVIDVTREKVANPNYGMTFGQEGSQEPPFLKGNLESITLLVPKAAEELLYFAVDNGTLHISVVPHAAVLEGASPSTGVLWEDIVRFFQEERLHTLGVVTDTVISTISPVSPTATITGTPALPVPATPAPAPGAEEGSLPTPTPATGTRAQLEKPGPAERQALRQAVEEEIARYNRAAPVHGHATLDEPADVVAERVLDEILGLGPLETLLADERLEDFYILGPHEVVVVTADGQRRSVGLDFGDRERLMNLARRALAQDGKRVDFARPFADARLRDGSRFHISIYPCAEPWPQIVIRRHRKLFSPGEDRLARLIGLGTLSPQAAMLLRTAVKARVSVLVTGATAAGKTTVINAMAGELDPLDAVVCIEDTRELDFPGKNVNYLVTRPPTPEGEGAVTQRYLVQQSLRKRPDWIVLGEARGAEAWDFAQAGNTGHAILGSVHANSARDGIERYRDLCLEAGENLREHVVLRGVVRAFRLVVYVEMDARLRRRVVRTITEVTGNVTEGNVPVLQDLFFWDDGQLRWAGSRPYPLLEKLLEAGGGYDRVLNSGAERQS